MTLNDSPVTGRKSPSDPGGLPVRGRRFAATRRDNPGLTVGSTSVLCLRATPGDVPLNQSSQIVCGVQTPVQDQTALGAHEGAFGQGELGFHRTAARTRLGRGEPPIRDHQGAARWRQRAAQ